MLVAQWAGVRRSGARVAWLSLEAGDNDPARFWMYVIEALRSVRARDRRSVAGNAARAGRQPRWGGPSRRWSTSSQTLSEQLVLVLDDYHAIEDERIHEGMASLIEHLPATPAHRDDITRGAAAPSRNTARAGPAQ